VLGNWRRTVGIVGNVVCFAFQATKATKHTAIQAQTQAQMRLPASRYESERCTERKAAQLANLFQDFDHVSVYLIDNMGIRNFKQKLQN